MNLVEQTIAAIEPADAYFRNRAKERLDLLTMPHWALGRLMDLAMDLAGMTGSMSPKFDNRVIVTMAGDHGVVAEGVSKYPQEVTVQMVYNFLRGGAGINAIARTAKADVVVVDMGIAGEIEGVESNLNFVSKRVRAGTNNMGVGPAMTRRKQSYR